MHIPQIHSNKSFDKNSLFKPQNNFSEEESSSEIEVLSLDGRNHPMEGPSRIAIKSQNRELTQNQNHQNSKISEDFNTSSRRGQRLWPKKSSSSKKPFSSGSNLRKSRYSMTLADRSDDLNLAHFRMLTSTIRAKESIVNLPDERQLSSFSRAIKGVTLPISASSPSLIKYSKLSMKFEEDADVSEGFFEFCKKKARQYGLPFIGLTSLKSELASLWNKFTTSFLIDSFSYALSLHEYDTYFFFGSKPPEPEQIETVVVSHCNYQLQKLDRLMINPSYLTEFHASNCRSQRRHRLSERRLEACKTFAKLSKYIPLFENDLLCLSDESSEDVMDESRTRNLQPWCSKSATELVEYIDKKYAEIRQTEYPRRLGRKPGKQFSYSYNLDGTRKPPESLPKGLPKDCYDPMWLCQSSPGLVHSLHLKKTNILQEVQEMSL
ncbi:hypothetical protein O181_001187 [Austropuccinia psidii MF-1]|uniref:Uncharacterized protein n=1 Tax=Austropuccinia psidii MF-1 TaxID=1389203 RepID=A0A9Q3GCS6_9BASI|nr:hypothetical protein [Austropuccinia psidii MF-1]